MIQDGGDDVITRTAVIGRGRRHGNVAMHGRMMTSSRRMGGAMLDDVIMRDDIMRSCATLPWQRRAGARYDVIALICASDDVIIGSGF